MRHIHLDPMGGIAGDMFSAALLHAFPRFVKSVLEAAGALAGATCSCIDHGDGTLTGSRFLVVPVEQAGNGRHDHDHDSDHAPHHHNHGHWKAIRSRIDRSALSQPVKQHAIGIFAHLAAAEARVHGVAADDVVFHEVGAADSIADIVAAAWLIDAVGPATWSVSSLPIGGGTVRTAHGLMPVPAPATALLLEGFSMHDDGVGGERVTPTGAAILRHLNCGTRQAGVVGRSGFGFGTRRLEGISNCLRALVFDTREDAAPSTHRELAVVSFEVDDQSGEDLAAGLERVRAMDGVHDVVQMPAFGKKSRLAVHIQVLVRPDALDAAVEGCFRETTTIGLRTHLVQGRALPRRFADVSVDGHPVRVKVVDRPGGATGKAEADHVLALETHAARATLRRDAERLAETKES